MSEEVVKYDQPDGAQDYPDPFVYDPVARRLGMIQDIPIERKNKAYELYMGGDDTLEEIATAVDVDKRAIAMWAKKHGWAESRKRLQDEYTAREDSLYIAMLAKKRRETAERHIRIGSLIEQQIEKRVQNFIDEGMVMDSKTMRAITESLASVAAVTARASAIAERPSISLTDEGDSDKNRKAPLINLNIGTARVSARNEKTITVEPEETNEPPNSGQT